MQKWEQLKKVVKNPPAERLAGIEYRSHFLQMLGITFVCVMLIFKGFWYIIFALIFGLGISYAQGMTAYQKYQIIKQFQQVEDPLEYEKEISFTRRRSKIVNHVYGNKAGWFASFFAVIITVFIVPTTLLRWQFVMLYFISIPFIYLFIYYFFLFWYAYEIYEKEMKDVA